MSVFPSSMHLHTHFGDGANSPEEMILAAIDHGFVSVGLSEHAYAPYDLDVCIPKSKMEAYQTEVLSLKDKYASKIDVSCGLEADFYQIADYVGGGWGHIIGSVHYVRSKKTDKYYTIDFNPEDFEEGIEDAGGGSVQTFVEQYGENLLNLVKFRPDIVGHLDVISKLNRDNRFFDPKAGWYKAIWEKVTTAVAAAGLVCEINTGGMARGYVDHPYPSGDILRLLHSKGGAVTICSDAHEKNMINFGFEQSLDILRKVGYKSVKLWRNGRFEDFPIN